MQEHDIRLWHGGTEPMTTVFFRFRISAGLGGGFQGMWTWGDSGCGRVSEAYFD